MAAASRASDAAMYCLIVVLLAASAGLSLSVICFCISSGFYPETAAKMQIKNGPDAGIFSRKQG
jgi:hypothetical protein